nr:MAG TPA: putative replisome organizer protein [Crassvirales sp.]
MIIEVETKLLNVAPNINLNQLVFLSMVLNKNQIPNQDVHKIVSLINDDDISYLVSQGLITVIENDNTKTYQETDLLKQKIAPVKDYFDLFYEMYPSYVLRPDGSKSYLRANINKCRHFFDTTTGKSIAMKEHLIKCLEFEISKKMKSGKLCFMKTMWRWLIDHQWEETEEEMQDVQNTENVNSYGTELL